MARILYHTVTTTERHKKHGFCDASDFGKIELLELQPEEKQLIVSFKDYSEAKEYIRHDVYAYRRLGNRMAYFSREEDAENYKTENDWNKLFNGKRITGSGKLTRSPEYYELPIALQFGIFIQYAATINVNGFYTNSIGINNPKHSIEFQIKKLEQNL